MAYSKNPSNNLNGFSGILSNVVVKQYKGMTVLASRPRRSRKKPTVKKKAVNDQWQVAVLYAKSVIKNPHLKLALAIMLKIDLGKVYSTLVADFMKNKGVTENMIELPLLPDETRRRKAPKAKG